MVSARRATHARWRRSARSKREIIWYQNNDLYTRTMTYTPDEIHAVCYSLFLSFFFLVDQIYDFKTLDTYSFEVFHGVRWKLPFCTALPTIEITVFFFFWPICGAPRSAVPVAQSTHRSHFHTRPAARVRISASERATALQWWIGRTVRGRKRNTSAQGATSSPPHSPKI